MQVPDHNRTGPNWKRAAQFPAQCLNTASRWPFWTIHRCGRHATSSSAARRRGSRSPTICRNMRNTRRRAKTSADRDAASGRHGHATGRVRRSGLNRVPQEPSLLVLGYLGKWRSPGRKISPRRQWRVAAGSPGSCHRGSPNFLAPPPAAFPYGPVRECRDTQTGGDMTPNILENISAWLVDWSLVTIMGNTTPPREPNDENDENDEDDEDDKDDKDDKDDEDDDEDDENDDDERQDEPAVVREPDE